VVEAVGVAALIAMGAVFSWVYITFLLGMAGVAWARESWPWRWLDKADPPVRLTRKEIRNWRECHEAISAGRDDNPVGK
jgi:hypothetical protein